MNLIVLKMKMIVSKSVLLVVIADLHFSTNNVITVNGSCGILLVAYYCRCVSELCKCVQWFNFS